jgi:hypothetical protein
VRQVDQSNALARAEPAPPTHQRAADDVRPTVPVDEAELGAGVGDDLGGRPVPPHQQGRDECERAERDGHEERSQRADHRDREPLVDRKDGAERPQTVGTPPRARLAEPHDQTRHDANAKQPLQRPDGGIEPPLGCVARFGSGLALGVRHNEYRDGRDRQQQPPPPLQPHRCPPDRANGLPGDGP